MPAGVFGDHQRLVDEQGELVQNLVALHPVGAGDRLGGIEVEATQEHGQPAEQDALGVGEKSVRPIHRGAQGLLSAHRNARATGQQAEAVMQTVDDLRQRQGAHSRRRELDRQRHPVQAPADLCHRAGIVVVNDEAAPGQTGTIGEQLNGVVGQR